jgi:hypothetical protein
MKKQNPLFRPELIKFLEKKEIDSYMPTTVALEALGIQVWLCYYFLTIRDTLRISKF